MDAIVSRYEADCPMCGVPGWHYIKDGKFVVQHNVGPCSIGKYEARFSIYCSLDFMFMDVKSHLKTI